MNWSKRVAMTSSLVVGLAAIGVAPALAAPTPSAPIEVAVPQPAHNVQATFTAAEWAQAYREFNSTELDREYSRSAGVETATFHVTPDLSLTLVNPESIGEVGEEITRDSRLGVGKTKYGYWFSFNQFDQNVLSNTLITAGIVAAICAIPGVGAVACALAGIVVGVAVSYIHKKGVCSQKRNLYWYDVKGGSTIQCRTSAPK
ncbi:hypothetical protein EDF46_0167 [Frondihabitans sp. PhB188]|uniref:hypothetical protein n=1 Tax=Frondihabitans sp. PhB188 TaxID=2485200 RepID=UPI000FAA3F95|nr:hypothetical protein [Frondihabitans sp. PhB188]ROQ40805.1 hypothetical protein EDF46_0167 [Frondihabitans sp. PhB188]